MHTYLGVNGSCDGILDGLVHLHQDHHKQSIRQSSNRLIDARLQRTCSVHVECSLMRLCSSISARFSRSGAISSCNMRRPLCTDTAKHHRGMVEEQQHSPTHLQTGQAALKLKLLV